MEKYESLRKRPQIVLLGGQTLPNFIPLLELGATEVSVVHTPDIRLEPFKRACANFGIEVLDHKEVPAHDEATAITIIRDIKFGKDAVLNYTGGTKPMSVAALQALGSKVSAIVYFDGSRLWIRDPSGDSSYELKIRLNVSQLLQANLIPNGIHEDSEYHHQVGLNPNDAQREVARAIARRLEAYQEWLLGAGCLALEGVPRTKIPEALGVLGCPQIHASDLGNNPSTFLRSLWLEAWAFDVIDRNRETLKVDDIVWSVRIIRREGGDETDLDVAVAANNQFAFISCKAAMADNLFDEVFEVADRRRRLGGRHGQGALLHWHVMPLSPKAKSAKAIRQAANATRFTAPPVRLIGGECFQNEGIFLRELEIMLKPPKVD